MKKFLVFLVTAILLFSSCSNTEQSPVPDTKEVIPESTLTFTYKEFIPEPDEGIHYSPWYSITNNYLIYSSKEDGKERYGYMDLEFNKVTDPIYCQPPIFINGLACGVIEGRWSDYAVIDENLVHKDIDGTIPFLHEGEWVYAKTERFTHKQLDKRSSSSSSYKIFSPEKYKDTKIDEVLIPMKATNGMYGYKLLLDVYHKKVTGDDGYQIPPIFERAYEFSEGLALVRNDEKYGYINTDGKVVIGYQFTGGSDFLNGLARVEHQLNEVTLGETHGNIYYSFIDSNGMAVSEGKYVVIREFREGFASANSFYTIANGGVMVDETGAEHFAGKFRIAYGFIDGITLVHTSGGEYYYMDKNGYSINGETYSNAGEFSDGLAVVLIGKRYGYIGTDGVVKIEPIYEYATSFNSGFAVVKLPGESMSYVIDKMGNKYLENLSLHELSQFNEDGYALGYSMVDDENKIYYLIHLEN